jgi:hypothetical protein
LGIVYGDIGTSPLYAMDQLFFGRASAPTTEEVLGGVSLVIWTITIIVAVKYAILVLRAQNDGEGGLFALYGLLHEQARHQAAIMGVDARSRLAFWRRYHHAGNQRRLGCRGASSRHAIVKQCGCTDHDRSSDRFVCHSI